MSIFSAIGSLVGGLFGNKAADKRQNEMLQWQEHQNRNQVRFRVEDAKAAGVHPLTALGATLHSPSPVVVGDRPDFGNMGQNIGRALDATMSGGEKVNDYTRTVQALTLDRMRLENEVIKNQLGNSAMRTVHQAGNPPTVMQGDRDFQVASRRADVKSAVEQRDWDALAGVPYKRVPGPSGQQIEDEYGEVAIPHEIARYLRGLHANWDTVYAPAQRRAYENARWRYRAAKTMNRRGDYGYW